jgi:hypothetical protein
MQTSIKVSMSLLVYAATSAVGSVQAAVTVNFIKPDSYAEMPFSPQARETVLKDLRTHFTALGRDLPAGLDLTLDILDVSLAGRPAFSRRGAEDFRVLRGGADWPMMRLRYSLESNGKVIRSGEDRLSDMDYLHHAKFAPSETSLRYEKQMIDDWFRKNIMASPR